MCPKSWRFGVNHSMETPNPPWPPLPYIVSLPPLHDPFHPHPHTHTECERQQQFWKRQELKGRCVQGSVAYTWVFVLFPLATSTPKKVWVLETAMSVRSSFHVVRTKRWSWRTLPGKICFGLDLLQELFELAQNSPNSRTHPICVCWTEPERKTLSGVKESRLSWAMGRRHSAQKPACFSAWCAQYQARTLQAIFLGEASRSQKATPSLLRDKLFPNQVSSTWDDGNIFKGIILGRFPVIQHFQTYPNGFWNIFSLLRAAFRMR